MDVQPLPPTSPTPSLEGDEAADVEQMTRWFRANFENPEGTLPVNSDSGGWEWTRGGPFRAREVLVAAFPDAAPQLVESAAGLIETDGVREWSPVASPTEGPDDPIRSVLGHSTPLLPVLEAEWPESDMSYLGYHVQLALIGACERAADRGSRTASGLPLVEASDVIAGNLALSAVADERWVEPISASASRLGKSPADLFSPEALERWRADARGKVRPDGVLRWDAVTLLATASELRQKTNTSERAIGVRHVLAAAFFTAEGQGGLDALGLLAPDFVGIRESFIGGLRESDVGQYGDGPEAWEEVLRGIMQQDLLFHSIVQERPAFSADTVPAGGAEDSADPLGTRADATALANLILLESAQPPLAIGIFGSWGSGKSTLMRRLRERIALQNERDKQHPQPADEDKDTRRVTHVVQLEFNAWSFIDSNNLWASLTAEIFDQLAAGGGEQWAQAKGKRLVREVAQRLSSVDASKRSADAELVRQNQVIADATERLEQARIDGKSAAFEAVSQVADQVLPQDRREGGAQPARGSRPMVDALRQMVSREGRSAEVRLVEGIGDAGRLVKGVFAAHLLFRRSGSRKWLVLGGGVVIALAAAILIVFGRGWLAAVPIGSIAIGAAWLLRYLAEGVRVLTLVGEQARARRQAAAGLEAEALSDIAVAREKKQQAERQSAADGAELSRLNLDGDVAGDGPVKLLEFLLHDSADINSIRSQVGVLAAVRRCFDNLDSVIKGQRASPGTGNIDRIVLYIDDLDRCDADQVVRVLEAVHLLLAFECFVVVVAIDARWIRQSLELQHPQFKRVAGSQIDEAGRPTTTDYLEKIFQIPFWVRPFRPAAAPRNLDAPSAYRAYLDQLLGPEPDEQRGTIGSATDHQAEPTEGEGKLLRFEGIEPRRPVEIAKSEVKKLSLTPPERKLLARLGPLAGKSPRATKSFVNIYRLIRGSLDARTLRILLAGGGPDTPSFPSLMFALAVDVGLAADDAAAVREGLLAADAAALNDPPESPAAANPSSQQSDTAGLSGRAVNLAEAMGPTQLDAIVRSALAGVAAALGCPPDREDIARAFVLAQRYSFRAPEAAAPRDSSADPAAS